VRRFTDPSKTTITSPAAPKSTSSGRQDSLVTGSTASTIHVQHSHWIWRPHEPRCSASTTRTADSDLVNKRRFHNRRTSLLSLRQANTAWITSTPHLSTLNLLITLVNVDYTQQNNWYASPLYLYLSIWCPTKHLLNLKLQAGPAWPGVTLPPHQSCGNMWLWPTCFQTAEKVVTPATTKWGQHCQ